VFCCFSVTLQLVLTDPAGNKAISYELSSVSICIKQQMFYTKQYVISFFPCSYKHKVVQTIVENVSPHQRNDYNHLFIPPTRFVLNFCAYKNSSTPYKRVKNSASEITSNTVNLTINNCSHYQLRFKRKNELFKK
jgi:hypothetical protein